MKLKTILQNNIPVVKLYEQIKILATKISPVLNTKLTFLLAKGNLPNLKNPKTLEEKLQWLKLNTYNNNPLVTMCADKYLVRDYVTQKGYPEMLNELYFSWNTTDEIQWDSLPNEFAIKCNHGSGYNIITKNKNTLKPQEVKNTLDSWLKTDQWLEYSEVNYKNINKKIICEKYLETDQGEFPNDYKIYCFNGKPTAILVISDRESDTKGVFMTPEWKFISNVSKYSNSEKLPLKPLSLEKMVEAAEILSAPFPFVRVDFYQYNDKPIFGEMTFTPAGGLYLSKTDVDGKSMDQLLDIKNIE